MVILQHFLGAIGCIILRALSIFLTLDGIILTLLRRNNSNSSIRKIKAASPWWKRITSICFWNIKCAKLLSLRIVISVRTISVITWGLPLVAEGLYFGDPIKFSVISSWIYKGILGFELFLCILMPAYFAYLLRNKYNK